MEQSVPVRSRVRVQHCGCQSYDWRPFFIDREPIRVNPPRPLLGKIIFSFERLQTDVGYYSSLTNTLFRLMPMVGIFGLRLQGLKSLKLLTITANDDYGNI